MTTFQPQEGSDVILIKKNLLADAGSADALREIKALTDEDKTQLGEGIRNGTMTY